MTPTTFDDLIWRILKWICDLSNHVIYLSPACNNVNVSLNVYIEFSEIFTHIHMKPFKQILRLANVSAKSTAGTIH